MKHIIVALCYLHNILFYLTLLLQWNNKFKEPQNIDFRFVLL